MFTQLDYMEKRGSPSGTTFCRQLFWIRRTVDRKIL